MFKRVGYAFETTGHRQGANAMYRPSTQSIIVTATGSFHVPSSDRSAASRQRISHAKIVTPMQEPDNRSLRSRLFPGW